MKKNKRSSILNVVNLGISFVLIAALFHSCVSTSTLTDGSDKPIKGKEPITFYNNTIKYKSFSARAASSYKDDNQSHNFTTHLKMQYSEGIWSSVTALSGVLEIARALITPDTIKALLKLEKQAFLSSYPDGVAKLNTDIPYDALENLFIGNPLISGAAINKVEQTDTTITIYVAKDDFVSSLTYETNSGQLTHQYIKSDAKQFSCELLYYNYKEISDKQMFSFKRIVNINNKGKPMTLTLDFNKAEINVPVTYSLNIPSNYTIINKL